MKGVKKINITKTPSRLPENISKNFYFFFKSWFTLEEAFRLQIVFIQHSSSTIPIGVGRANALL